MNQNFFNLSKRKKRDILFEMLLGSAREGMVTPKEIRALNRVIKGLFSETTPALTDRQPAWTKNVTAGEKKAAKTKEKTTLYLSPEISESLNRARDTIRSLVAENVRPSITRSHIVDQSLAMTLLEFEARGKNSRLMRSIMQNT